MIDPIQLKEVNDAIDNDVEYKRETFELAKMICWECKHYHQWHDEEARTCAYYSDGSKCECDGFISEQSANDRDRIGEMYKAGNRFGPYP